MCLRCLAGRETYSHTERQMITMCSDIYSMSWLVVVSGLGLHVLVFVPLHIALLFDIRGICERSSHFGTPPLYL